MFNIGDTVIYGAYGVCKITGVETKNISGKNIEYLVLKPADDVNSTYYIPANSEIISSKMHKILTKEEIDRLIDSMPDEDDIWITNEAERKERYKRIISEGNHTQLIRLIKTVYQKKKELEADARRLHASDERFFKEAETALHGEFKYVLKLSEADLLDYILKRIENNGDICAFNGT